MAYCYFTDGTLAYTRSRPSSSVRGVARHTKMTGEYILSSSPPHVWHFLVWNVSLLLRMFGVEETVIELGNGYRQMMAAVVRMMFVAVWRNA